MQSEQSPIFFIHLRNVHTDYDELNPKGGITVAYRLSVDKNKESVSIFYAIAKCSEKDLYSKRRGRQIASGRLRLLSEELIEAETELPLGEISLTRYELLAKVPEHLQDKVKDFVFSTESILYYFDDVIQELVRKDVDEKYYEAFHLFTLKEFRERPNPFLGNWEEVA